MTVDPSGSPESEPDASRIGPVPEPTDPSRPKPKQVRGRKEKPQDREQSSVAAGPELPNKHGVDPLALVDRAVAALPSARYVWLLLAITAWIAVSQGFGLGLRVTFIGPMMAIPLLVVAFVFDRASKESRNKFGMANLLLVYGCIVVFFAAVACLFSASAFGVPNHLVRVLGLPGGDGAVVREAFGKNKSLDLGLHLAKDALSRPNLSERATMEERTKFSMAKWLEWVYEGARPKNLTENVLVLKSRSPSSKNYELFHAVITFEDNARFELIEGCAFIVSKMPGDSLATVYRQQPFRIDASSPVNGNGLTLKDLAEGDEIVIILKVRSRDKGNLPLDVNHYGIHCHSSE